MQIQGRCWGVKEIKGRARTGGTQGGAKKGFKARGGNDFSRCCQGIQQKVQGGPGVQRGLDKSKLKESLRQRVQGQSGKVQGDQGRGLSTSRRSTEKSRWLPGGPRFLAEVLT